ncbi:MAG: F0F1 ATP synthase subunit alpha [Candidatus Levybacteria bacterium]|nr:F0F1 ATP synthase subunit alpha [Candidatus Levybacteria bacterium]MBP9815244.1 F0F1 ATP synthase subunit alpha [Candidatus Levybacteria bacterium]
MDPFQKQLDEIQEFGVVQSIVHPIVFVAGLPGASLFEIILFETGELGQVFLMEKNQVHVLSFSSTPVKVGTKCTRTNHFAQVPVGPELFGKIIDPLGNPFSESETYTKPKEFRELEARAPGIGDRAKITEPFLTGVTIVDMMVPLGKGQKELIIGDRKTGKTSFLLSTLKNQIQNGGIAVYAAIGKKKSDIKAVMDYFKHEGLLDKIIIVASSSYDSPSLIFLTPYAGATIAEYFRDQGQDVVLVLDDLSTHSKFYREISLLSRRFPGRDSYPGDIFYIHARLLERAGNFIHPSGKNVSITMLPVVDIIEGDFTGFISTNLMGMTDGHLFFDSNAYYQGRRPAVNVGLSVTRVGRQATPKILRSINRELTAFLTLYQRMQDLSHFGAELTDAVKQVLRTGDVIYKFFEQTDSVIVPPNIQLLMFSMIWLKLFEDSTVIEKISIYRQNLINAYLIPQNKELIDETIGDIGTFNELLGAINAKKQDFITLANTEISPEQKAK